MYGTMHSDVCKVNCFYSTQYENTKTNRYYCKECTALVVADFMLPKIVQKRSPFKKFKDILELLMLEYDDFL